MLGLVADSVNKELAAQGFTGGNRGGFQRGGGNGGAGGNGGGDVATVAPPAVGWRHRSRMETSR